MPPLPRHQTQHASAPRIRVCVRSMANKQLLDTQVSLQPCGGPKQLFVRDEQQPIVISQHQPRCGHSQSLSTWDKVPKHPSTHHHVTLLQVVERHSHLAAATQEKNTIHMFCINAWVASSSFCFLFSLLLGVCVVFYSCGWHWGMIFESRDIYRDEKHVLSLNGNLITLMSLKNAIVFHGIEKKLPYRKSKLLMDERNVFHII